MKLPEELLQPQQSEDTRVWAEELDHMLLIVKAPPPPHPARGWPSLPIADCEGVRRRRQRSQVLALREALQ